MLQVYLPSDVFFGYGFIISFSKQRDLLLGVDTTFDWEDWRVSIFEYCHLEERNRTRNKTWKLQDMCNYFLHVCVTIWRNFHNASRTMESSQRQYLASSCGDISDRVLATLQYNVTWPILTLISVKWLNE